MIKGYIVREFDCSKKFIDNTRYQYNLYSIDIFGKEMILSHLFSENKIPVNEVIDILLDAIKKEIKFEKNNSLSLIF